MISLFWAFVIILRSWDTGTSPSPPLPCGCRLPRIQGQNKDQQTDPPQVQPRPRARRLFKLGYACHTLHHIPLHPASHVPERLYIHVPLALGPLQGRKITCSVRSPVPDFITARHADALLVDHCMAWRTAAIGCIAYRRYRCRVRLRLGIRLKIVTPY